MRNLLNLKLTLSYQGQFHEFQGELDLDEQLNRFSRLPDFHNWLARQHQVDSYSYLYESLEMEPVEIVSATGLAAEFIVDGEFQNDAFIKAWQAHKALPGLAALAKTHLNLDLAQDETLKSLLLEAYQMGFEQGQQQTQD
jgi:hypothetical protein